LFQLLQLQLQLFLPLQQLIKAGVLARLAAG
jgi:hypothetical protein